MPRILTLLTFALLLQGCNNDLPDPRYGEWELSGWGYAATHSGGVIDQTWQSMNGAGQNLYLTDSTFWMQRHGISQIDSWDSTFFTLVGGAVYYCWVSGDSLLFTRGVPKWGDPVVTHTYKRP